jgi:hypothetical protein
MSDTKILPCPFCGKDAFVFKYEEQINCARRPTIYYGIGCKTMDCYGGQDPDMAYFISSENAIKTWNKRAT